MHTGITNTKNAIQNENFNSEYTVTLFLFLRRGGCSAVLTKEYFLSLWFLFSDTITLMSVCHINQTPLLATCLEEILKVVHL
jgi:hypothetical protein